ncbi:hypothetical protein GCM10018962_77640 [Dactylosporangium matsuzakiense]
MQRKPGRKGKGERQQLSVRFPAEHFAAYQAAADEAGLPLGDYVVREMALRHSLELPEWLQTERDQDQLPLAS